MTESQTTSLIALVTAFLGPILTYLVLRATLSTKATFADKQVAVNSRQADINAKSVADAAETADIANRAMATTLAASANDKLWAVNEKMHALEIQSVRDSAEKGVLTAQLDSVKTELSAVKTSLNEARDEIKGLHELLDTANKKITRQEELLDAAAASAAAQSKLLKEAYDLIKKQSEQIQVLVEAKTAPGKEDAPVTEMPLTQAEMKTNDAANLVQATADVKSEGLISNV